MDEVWAGDYLLAFDGRVLEVFGFPTAYYQGEMEASKRFHVANVALRVDGPDRKGRRTVIVTVRRRSKAGCEFRVEEEGWPPVASFLERVSGAIAEAGSTDE